MAKVIRERVLAKSMQAFEKVVAREIRRRAAQVVRVDEESVRRQITAVDKKIDNATERLVSVHDSLVPAVEQKLLELRRERDGLEASLTPTQPDAPTLDAKQVAAKVKELETILADGSPAKVRQALSKIISRVTLDFRPSKQNKRGQRFDFVKGTIELCTQQWGSQATCR